VSLVRFRPWALKRLSLRVEIVLAVWAIACAVAPAASAEPRPRLRDWGVVIGGLAPGPLDAITDVAGVRVGHATVTHGTTINTGVTVVLPPGDNPFRDRVRAAIVVGNGFGKLTGALQVNELGELESPIVLTCTLCVGKAWDATVKVLLGLPGNEDVRSVNPVVGETNDGFLNDIRRRPIEEADVLHALRDARGGPVEEGSVGAGRGTVALDWKGGIGTSSRTAGGHTVGVLVQSNFPGTLTIAGVPVGRELGSGVTPVRPGPPGGSIMIVVATDAPLDHRELERLARRALVGLGRAGAAMSNGSGDFVIAFSTSREPLLGNDALSPLFLAVADATEEAIVNSLLRATTVRGIGGTAEAVPLPRLRRLLEQRGAIPAAR
jgi:D-aminopeptidase